MKDKAKADSIALEHKQLLQQNYQKSLNIIDELNASSEKTKILLDNTSEVLKAQEKSGELLSKQIIESSKINSSIQESGREITRTVKEATKKLEDNVTGGDSFCHIQIVNTGVRKFRLAAINESENNLPNVIITIQNYSALEECSFKLIDDIKRIDGQCG